MTPGLEVVSEQSNERVADQGDGFQTKYEDWEHLSFRETYEEVEGVVMSFSKRPRPRKAFYEKFWGDEGLVLAFRKLFGSIEGIYALLKKFSRGKSSFQSQNNFLRV